MTAGMQLPTALQTDLFGLRQFMDDLFHRKARKIQLSFSFLFSPFVCDLLQFWLRHLFTRLRFRLMEQRHLLQDRLCLLAGRTKTLPSYKPKLLCQLIDLPMQECNFIFFFIQQRTPLRRTSLLCFHA